MIWCVDHNVHIERNKRSFEYTYNCTKRKYYPDFVVGGRLTEVKGYRTKQWEAKLSAMTEPLEVLYRADMQQYIEYAQQKFGEDFTVAYS